MLFFRDLRYSDIAHKNACSSVGLPHKLVYMLLFSPLYSVVSRNTTFLIETWKSNVIVFFFFYLFIYLMNVINSPFVPLHVETMPSIYLKYSRELCLCVCSSIAFGLKICHKGITLLICELCLLIQNGIHKRYAMPAASVVVWRLWSFKMFIWSELRW